MADSSLWKIKLTETNPSQTRPPAPPLLSREAPARTAHPPSPGPAASQKVFLVRGTEDVAGLSEGKRGRKGGDRRAGPGKCMVPGASAASQEDIGAGSSRA